MAAHTENAATVASVERAFIILNLLAHSPEGLGPREIGRSLGFSAGSVQKILNTLRMQHVVNKKPNSDRYTLGVSALRLAQQIITQSNLLSVLRPYLEELAEQTGETSFWAVRDSLTAVYIDKVVSKHELRVDPPLGVPRPLNATAVGQLLLAYAHEDLIHQLVEANSIVAASQYSITDPEALRARVSLILRNGYAYDSREYLVSSSSMAVPVFAEEGRVVAALAICGPAERIESHLDKQRNVLLSVASELNASLGYVPQG